MKALLLQIVALVQLRSEFALGAVLSYSSAAHAVRLVQTLSVVSVRPTEEYCDDVHTLPLMHSLSEVAVSGLFSYCADVQVATAAQVRSEVLVGATRLYWVPESHTVDKLQLRLLTYESLMSPVPRVGAAV
jgi:hypothetical protein